MLKHQHLEFPSDIFLTLLGASGSLTLGTAADGSTTEVTLEQFLATNMAGRVILSVTLPQLSLNTQVNRWPIDSNIFLLFYLFRFDTLYVYIQGPKNRNDRKRIELKIYGEILAMGVQKPRCFIMIAWLKHLLLPWPVCICTLADPFLQDHSPCCQCSCLRQCSVQVWGGSYCRLPDHWQAFHPVWWHPPLLCELYSTLFAKCLPLICLD